MAAIKKFFEKLKLESKFKKAGDGHKLSENSNEKNSDGANAKNSASSSASVSQPTKVATSTSSSFSTSGQQLGSSKKADNSNNVKRAGEAAIARFSEKKSTTALGTSEASVKLQVRREMDEQKRALMQLSNEHKESGAKELVLDGPPSLAVTGVFYRCPLFGDELLPRAEMERKIEDFLYSQLPEEPEMTAALMIQTLNKDGEKSRIGIETVCKYLDNIIDNPKEPKYRKIRALNKAFQEKVFPLKGAIELLQAAGFERQLLPGPEGVDEEYYVLSEEKAIDSERIKNLKENMLLAEPVKPILDRNRRIFYPSQHAARMELPPDFYIHGIEDIRAQQQLRTEAVEKLGMLRTKEMRERDRIQELRRYKYCLIRVRFPDGIILQGTFRASEPISAVMEYVRECLHLDWIPFSLTAQTGQLVNKESNRCLAELELVPASILNFAYDSDVVKDLTASAGSMQFDAFLKEELLAAIEKL